MIAYSEQNAQRRRANAPALAAFGVESSGDIRGATEVVRQGSGPTVFTIGYERRNGEELMFALRDAGVEMLVDVRQKAMSRRPDFRKKALETFCEQTNIQYRSMPNLGSTDELRNQLRSSGDFEEFRESFLALASQMMSTALAELKCLAKSSSIALLCYERCHGECHRSILGDMLHESIDATIVAIQ